MRARRRRLIGQHQDRFYVVLSAGSQQAEQEVLAAARGRLLTFDDVRREFTLHDADACDLPHVREGEPGPVQARRLLVDGADVLLLGWTPDGRALLEDGGSTAPERVHAVELRARPGVQLAFRRETPPSPNSYLGVVLPDGDSDVLVVRRNGETELQRRMDVQLMPVRVALDLAQRVPPVERGQDLPEALVRGDLERSLREVCADGSGVALTGALLRHLLGADAVSRALAWCRHESLTTRLADDVLQVGRPPMAPPEAPYVFPRQTALILDLLRCGRAPVAVHGAPGVGKTVLFAHLAAALGLELYRVNLSAHARDHKLIGSTQVVRDGAALLTRFELAGVARAFARPEPTLLLLDEWDLAPPGVVLGELGGLLEAEPFLRLPDGTRVARGHPRSRIALASNTGGHPSVGGPAYVGARLQSPAVRNRLQHVEITPPSVTELVERAPGLSEGARVLLIVYAALIDNAAASAAEPLTPPSPRAIADALFHVGRGWPVAMALEHAVVSRVPPEERARHLTLVASLRGRE